MSKSNKTQAPVQSAIATVIAGRGTTHTASNKSGYLRALLVAVVADLNAGVEVTYTSSCNNYLDIASGKALENRVGKQEGAANSRRVIRALCSQELALLCQTTVKSRLDRAKAGSAAHGKLSGLNPDTVIQVIQDGSTAFDAFMSKVAGVEKDELRPFALWFRDKSGSAWQTKAQSADMKDAVKSESEPAAETAV